MATINHCLIGDKNKSSVSDRDYFLCDICESNGYPNEKVVYRYEGLRSEEEEGFITIFSVYDYPIQRGKNISHVHKYDKLIDKLINLVLREFGVKT